MGVCTPVKHLSSTLQYKGLYCKACEIQVLIENVTAIVPHNFYGMSAMSTGSKGLLEKWCASTKPAHGLFESAHDSTTLV